MNRLDFKLPEFTRIIWATDRAKRVWKPRIEAINHVWTQIERSTVSSIRDGALQSIDPENLVEFQAWCHNAQKEFAIIGREGSSPVYGNSSQPVTKGRPWHYRVYIGREPKKFAVRWAEGNQMVIGEMLGYPPCCSEFFQKYWVEEEWRDLTYPMFNSNPEANTGFGPAYCNILLRHLGIRSVFHLPCSFNCVATAKIGEEIIEYGTVMGFEPEMKWLMEMLSWPVKWSSLHGVAITTTPILKIISSSDALAGRVDLDKPGLVYPEEGATGTEFPFQSKLSMLEGIKDTWTDNGFKSYSAMRQAHSVIMRLVSTILLDSGRILDLGCGNGVLLERINKEFPNLIPYGIESDSERYWRAVERIGDNIKNGDLFNTDFYLHQDFLIIFISLNRFFETDEEAVDLFLRHLRNHTKYLIVYCYEGWKPDFDELLLRHFVFVGIESDANSEARILKPR